MLRISNISFPGLGIDTFSVDSVAFRIFGVEIAWYALFITFGMLCAITYAIVQGKKIGITFDDVIDYALFTIPFGVIGARLYYVLTELEHYKTFWDVINIREGGLAIYGGIIAGTLTVIVVSYFKKIKFFAFGDCVAPGVLLAQGIGRWGNFMNGEAYGGPYEGFLRMGLLNFNTMNDEKLIEAGADVSEMVFVHPTFLYESLWNLLGVLLVYLFAKFIGKKYDGQLILLIFGWYGLGRMFIEGLRTDSLYIPGTELRISQVLAAAIFIVCLGLLIYFAIRQPKAPLYHKAPAEGEKAEKEEFPFIDKIKALFSSKKTEESKEETVNTTDEENSKNDE